MTDQENFGKIIMALDIKISNILGMNYAIADILIGTVVEPNRRKAVKKIIEEARVKATDELRDVISPTDEEVKLWRYI